MSEGEVELVVVGRRERKKLQTRRALEEAALRLFAERGFDGTTIEDITEAVDVAPRTFFRHFASKEDVLLAEKRAQLRALRAFLDAVPEGAEPLEVIHQAMHRLAVEYEEQRGVILLQAQLVERTPALLGAFLRSYADYETTITAAVARLTGCDPHREVYPTLVSAVTLAAIRTALAVWCTGGCRAHLPTLLDESFALLGTGLQRPPGRGREPRQAAPSPAGGRVFTTFLPPRD